MQGYLLDECKVDADRLTLLSLKELGVSCFWKSNVHVGAGLLGLTMTHRR